MKVKDLIIELGKFDPEMQVLFSSDEEGNVLHPKADIIETEELDEVGTALVIYPLDSSDDIY